MARSLIRTFLFLVFLFFLPRIANACGCYPNTTVLDDYEKADMVVVARMKSVTKGASRFSSDISHAMMTVEKVFKGDAKAGADLTFRQGDGVLDCSWQFYADQVGETYLLYLYQPEKPSEPFVVSTCNRSKGLENAKEDLLYLENIDKVRGRTRVSGVVTREGEDDGDYSGQQVRITGKNKTYVATTDKDGVYEIYDLPPGRYSLEPVLQSGWKVDGFELTREPTRAEARRVDLDLPSPKKVWFTLRAKQHFGANVELRIANRVTGRLTTPAGQPLKHVSVGLVHADSKSLAYGVFSESDGSFVIESVKPGSYNLTINYDNIRSSQNPFPKLYYPGVANADAAQVFTVKFGESIEGLKFVVPTFNETGFARKVSLQKRFFSRKGAKAQRNPLETRQRFAALRLCGTVTHPVITNS